MRRQRRGVRLVASSDEDENPSSPPNPNPSPLLISSSDDDATPAPAHPPHERQRPTSPPPSSTSTSSLNRGGANRDIEERLALLGLRLRGDWLHSCIAGIDGSRRMNADEKARLCFRHFLFEDMNVCGAGVLPENVDALHKVELEGPFVLQVDEIVNISLPLRDRYQNVHPGLKRCLKLLLSDGIQHVSAMEYCPIKDFDALSPAGLKVVIRNVVVRHGLLMLVPEVCKVLGGLAKDLELARQRLVSEIHKPYRGRRKQPAVSLSERASHAAWPTSEVTNNDFQVNASHDQVNASTANRTYAPPGNSSNVSSAHGFYAQGFMNQEPVNEHDQETTADVQIPIVPRPLHGIAISHTGSVAGDISAIINEDLGASTRISASSLEGVGFEGNGGFVGHVLSDSVNVREETLENTGAVSCPFPPSRVEHNVKDLHLPEDSEHRNILSREMEVPFTYFTCLLAKWAAREETTSSLQGRVKCFLTGVKAFQFKNRDTYELQVYVDDGSIIFEAIVDHLFVQNAIGHPPKVVNASLSSSDEKVLADMKEKMKRFQRFLSNFEGMMTVEISKMGSIPVVRNLIQGCSVCDAQLLMSRVSLTAPQSTAGHFSCPLSLSP